MKIYYFGNDLVAEDSLAVRVGKAITLENVDFIHCDDPLQLLDEQEITLLDVAEGIDTLQIIEGIEQLEQYHLLSVHDLDLGFFLELFKRLGKKQHITLYLLPQNYPYEQAVTELLANLQNH